MTAVVVLSLALVLSIGLNINQRASYKELREAYDRCERSFYAYRNRKEGGK